MALTLRRRFGAAAQLLLFVPLLVCASGGAARAEDPAERAAQIRDEILARRRAHDALGAYAQAQQRRDAAQARLDQVSIDLQAASERQARLREDRARIVAKLAEIETASQRERVVQRARVAAIYRAAGLGAGAAAWHLSTSADRVRLARYLIAAANRPGSQSGTLEVERGSHIAALDQNRIDEQNAASELRRLEEARVIAASELAQAGSDVETAAALANEQHPGATSSDVAAAAAELEQQVAARRAEEEAQAREEARAKAQAQARAKAEVDAKARAQTDALALAQARERAAQARKQQAPAGTGSGAKGETFDWSDQGAATAQQKGAAPAAQQGAQPDAGATPKSAGATAAAAEETDADAKKGLLSRLFGGNEEARRFAATKGSLAPPVSGKVMAKFGQRHENGATYRGVIVRAQRGSSVKSVAGGTVTFAGSVPGLGSTVIISHGGGRYHTVYGRLGNLRFKQGDRVRPGDVIGSMPGDDGDLDFEMRENGRAIDPRPWLRGAGDTLSQ